jgi:transcriptional regulator with XRE-family HTH domain
MMTPDMMANEIAQAFSNCRKFKRLTQQALADKVGCQVDAIKRIEASDFHACFALREKYPDASSLERRLCDAVGLTPVLCQVLDAEIIF